MHLTRFATLSTLLVALPLLGACSSSSEGTGEPGPRPDDATVFESADPSGESQGGPGEVAADASGAGGTSGAAPLAPSSSNENSAERAIAEADIIQIEGDTLYALSQYGGLSTIDIGTRDSLTLLGRHKIQATPFEMYAREGIVFALYQGYGEYVQNDDDSWSWAQTSHVVVLDARDPSHISELGKFPIPGYVADSRIVGDVLYVASFEDGYCWACEQNKPKTTVVSLDISTPSQVKLVDKLTFDEQQDYSWHRSIFVTDERMYVAGPEWGDNGPIGSTIQVVDISDPSGAMALGDSVEVAGQINNRWQMDEVEGVFRVISQSPEWNLSEPPHVQTFSVDSSDQLTPLGETTLALPRPEQLQSVRFDGDRAYAITFERTDPLFTVDLSDPSAPVQAGALEIPGWVYYMEPRGDRVLGLGFDQTAEGGSLHVSLFDVSDLSTPTMLDRVNFGGDWGWFAEDQDRIHKAFRVLDAEGLILMPYSGWVDEGASDFECGASSWQSGIQLIDWADDQLTLRGVAPTQSSARRGFLHDDRLFAMSDDRVESYDISDRDQPQATARVALAQYVQQLLPVGDSLLRLGQNWWTAATQLDKVSLADAATPTADGQLEVAQMQSQCYGGEWLQMAFSSGERAYLVFQRYDYDPNTQKEQQSLRVATIDASGTAPELLGDTTIARGPNYYNYYSYYTPYGLVDHGTPMLALGSTLVSTHTEVDYGDYTAAPKVLVSELTVTDLSDPAAASVKTVALPTGLGSTGLISSDNIVARSHFEASPTTEGAVRFYLDRVDVNDPAKPKLLDAINIPGSLLALDDAHQRALTVDYRSEVEQNVTAQSCYEDGNGRFYAPTQNYDWETTLGSCVHILYSVNLISYADGHAVRLGRHELERGQGIGQLATGDDRTFITVAPNYGYFYGPGIAVDCFGPCYYGGFQTQEIPLLTVSGLQGGDFAVGQLDIEGGDGWSYYTPMVAQGNRAVLSSGWRGSLSLVDASDVEAPTLVSQVQVDGYVSQLSVVGSTAVAALGYDGVQTIPMNE